MRNDEKERAEHVMLVDLGRNDLGRGERVWLGQSERPDVRERYSHVMHLVSAWRYAAQGSGCDRRIRRVFSGRVR